jgi:hypothetical protein
MFHLCVWVRVLCWGDQYGAWVYNWCCTGCWWRHNHRFTYILHTQCGSVCTCGHYHLTQLGIRRTVLAHLRLEFVATVTWSCGVMLSTVVGCRTRSLAGRGSAVVRCGTCSLTCLHCTDCTVSTTSCCGLFIPLYTGSNFCRTCLELSDGWVF